MTGTTTIYVLTPLRGMAAGPPTFRERARDEKRITFEVSSPIYPVGRDTPTGPWRSIVPPVRPGEPLARAKSGDGGN